MGKRNFLLGKGETLTSTVVVKTGAPDKVPPYTLSELKTRLTPMLKSATKKLDALPEEACPGGAVVGALTLNPEYIAKSYYPYELLRSLGLEAIGSKPLMVKPEKRSKGREPEEALSTELFVRGPKSAFHNWANNMPSWNEGSKIAAELVTVEQINVPSAKDKIKGTVPKKGQAVFEVVLHADELNGKKAISHFKGYLEHLGIKATLERHFYAGGLCFLEIEAPADHAEEIATYTTVRALRQMPQLRLLRPTIRAATLPVQSIVLPKGPSLDKKIKAAIFDGGIPVGHPVTKWAKSIDGIGVSLPHDEYLEHGIGVTSAFLFGHLDPTAPVPTPYCDVEHHRVLDGEPGEDPRELFEVLERIRAVMSKKKYDLVNLSLGPILPVDDDDVHAWTAVLDDLLASGDTLATVAVGNTGESDAAAGLNRIQVPADCVNALAVGACDSPDQDWQRASYSSIGPGRSPGLMKPDLVDFGGSMQRPFLVLGAGNAPTLYPTGGTSFSSPSTLRLAAGVRAHFGEAMDMLTIRALLIHSAETTQLPMSEVGRGRVARDLDSIVLCDDDTVRVVYQGEITPTKYLRAPIPLPLLPLTGRVSITATLCYTTNVDPHHPGNYTRAGLQATFRPHDEKRKAEDQIHADTATFFGKGQKGLTEEELRRDAWKWENCLHAKVGFMGTSLRNPAFDIHYNSRMDSHGHNPGQNLRYSMVISVKAPKIVDLYDQVVRRFVQLQQIRPVIDIPVRV